MTVESQKVPLRLRSEEITIRNMEKEDLPGVLEIERLSFRTPWTEILFLEELETPFCNSLVAVVEGAVKGSIHFAVILDEIHLRNVAVHPCFHRRGIATRLMEEMIERSLKKGAFLCFLEVRYSNRQALRLYEKFGFTRKGIRPLYYSDTCEDAIIMAADFSGRVSGLGEGRA
jgi:ribosomal-protein-alanine N-acetyltransferase